MKKNAFTVTAERTGNKVRLTLSGYIYTGSEKNSSAAIAEQLDALEEGDELTVLIRNCHGGSVPEGLTIYHDLKALDPTVLIDGVAASMGAIVALAGKTIKMSRHSRMMLHRVSVGASGTPDEVARTAEQAREYENELVSIVAERTGKTEKKTRLLYFTGEDVWLDASNCKKAGLVDAIVTGSLRKEIPTKELKKADPAGVVALFVAAMRKPEPKRIPLSMFRIKKNDAPKNVHVTALNKAKTITAKLIRNAAKELGLTNTFLFPVTDKLKSAADVDALLNKRLARIQDLKKQVAALEAKAAKSTSAKRKLERELVNSSGEARKKKTDKTPGGNKKDPMSVLSTMPHNKAADELIGTRKKRKLTAAERAKL